MSGKEMFFKALRTAKDTFNEAAGNKALKEHGLKRTKKEIGLSILGGKAAEVVAFGIGAAVCTVVAAPVVVAVPLCLAAGAAASTIPARLQANRIIDEHKQKQDEAGQKRAEARRRDPRR